jgi:hypothetical protein
MECDELTQPRNIPEDFDDDGLADDFDDDDDIADEPGSSGTAAGAAWKKYSTKPDAGN